MMTRQEVLFELDKVLEKPRGTLAGSERLDDLPEWDSLAILAYIAMVEKKTGVVLGKTSPACADPSRSA